MKVLKELVKDIERDFLINLVIGLRHERTSVEKASKASREYMSALPFHDYESLFDALYLLSNQYNEARKVYVKYSPAFYSEQTEKALKKIRSKGIMYGKL